MWGVVEVCRELRRENLKERDLLENLSVERRLILETDLKELECEGVERICLTWEKDRFLAVVKAVMKIEIP